MSSNSGPPALANFIEAADFPVLGANIDASAQVSLTGLIEPYTVIEVGGQSIGVFGLTTEDTSDHLQPWPRCDLQRSHVLQPRPQWPLCQAWASTRSSP